MRNIILFLFLLPACSFSQGWIKTCGYGVGLSLQETIDGGYIISGCTMMDNNFPEDVYIIKTDINGDTLWTRTIGTNGEECGLSIQQTNDSGYIIAGYSNYYGPGNDTYLIKTDVLGDTLWTKFYHDDRTNRGYSCIQTSDGGYAICSNKVNFGTSGDVLLIRTDENGDTLWTKTFGGDSYDIGHSIQQTNDGGFIITGSTESDSTAYDVYLIRTNVSGDTLWTETFGGDSYDIGHSVRQTTDGGFIIAGEAYPSDNQDVYLIKTNENGDALWIRTYGDESHNNGHSVKQTTDGGYIIAGSTGVIGGGNKVYLIKTNGNGDTLWTKTYGENIYNWGYSVIQTTDGEYVIAGSTIQEISGLALVYLIKTDADGNIVSTTEIPVPSTNSKRIKLVDLSGREIDKPLKNAPYIEIYDNGTTQKKMNIR